jgi:hypothetical protein
VCAPRGDFACSLKSLHSKLFLFIQEEVNLPRVGLISLMRDYPRPHLGGLEFTHVRLNRKLSLNANSIASCRES